MINGIVSYHILQVMGYFFANWFISSVSVNRITGLEFQPVFITFLLR